MEEYFGRSNLIRVKMRDPADKIPVLTFASRFAEEKLNLVPQYR